MISDSFLEGMARPVPQHVQNEYEYPEEDDNYQGEQLPRELENGPIEKRKCQDPCCIMLYFIMWIFMLYCAINTWGKGNVYDIYMPYDCIQRQCGKGVAEDYPNVYLLSELEYYCVSRCPGESDIGQELPCYQCSEKRALYSSIQFFTLCVPTKSEDLKYQNLVKKINYFGESQKYYADIQESWPIMLGCAGAAFIISAIVLLLIRFAAGCVVWGMVVLTFSLIEGFGAVYFFEAQGYFGQFQNEQQTQLLKEIGLFIMVIGLAALIAVVYFRKKIKEAIIILKAASDFLRAEWQVIFVPVYMQFIIIGALVFWVIFSALIFSATSNEDKTQSNPYVVLYMDKKTFWQISLFLFGMGWNVNFINALTHFVIGTCGCYWYYSHQGCETKGTIKKGFHNGLTKNLGSLLYGSVVLSLVWFIKFILQQISYFYKCIFKAGEHAPPICKIYIYCKWYTRCFDQCIKFLDKNAYTIMALSGEGFCISALCGFYLVYRNKARVLITQGLGEIFQYLGVAFIGVASATIYYFSAYYTTSIPNPLIPSIIVMVISTLIGSIFMSLYGYGVDTIMFCLFVDIEEHIDEGGPRSVPPVLKKYTKQS